MHKRKQQHAGFTLMELLVAVTLLGLMLFLVNELFQTTSVAVTTSVQTSKAIATTRIVGEQIDSDTAVMLGPNSTSTSRGGYLMIIQRRLRNVPMLDPDTLAEVTVDQIRSDQLVFIRDATNLRSMSAQDSSSYQSNLVGQPGDVAKVWYGHIQRTQNDGRVPTGGQNQLGGTDAGFDRFGSDWILGRQALLFNPTDAFELTKRTNQRADPTVSGARNLYTYADTAFYNSPVQNSGFPGNARLFLGLTDVTVQPYSALVSIVTNPSLALNVHNQAYISTAYHEAATPLRANPSPTDTNYEPWAIAQSHPIFAPNCSDFVVQFAADLNGNGRIDTQAGGSNADLGGVFWYDALTNQGVAWNNNTWQRLSDPRFQPYISLNADSRAFIFKLEDDTAYTMTGQPTSAWPYMIRIRYRLHGNRGRLVSNDPGALGDGLDNNGNSQVDEFGEDRIAGRWFEHVIKVPRPDAAP